LQRIRQTADEQNPPQREKRPEKEEKMLPSSLTPNQLLSSAADLVFF